ncbi:MAG TPA: metallophosphoesterase [Luteolibacter sp.]
MKTTRRHFLTTSASGLTGILATGSGTADAAESPSQKHSQALRICFLTDAHLPNANDVARLTNDQFHHQERVRAAFDHANTFKPDSFVFGGDNVFAVDQANDGGHLEVNARAQFNNWKAVVREKVKVPHHSVIGNHDLWLAHPPGIDAKTLAIESFEMPSRFYSWKMKGWKFIMLDVFGISGSPLDKEQWDWLQKELAEVMPTCVVTHAPILSLTGQLVGGTLGASKQWRELFFTRPHVKLALSGHNHMVDCCRMDQVTYICGGAVCGGWWEGAYQHFAPVFTVLDLHPDGTFKHKFIEYDGPSEKFKQMS